MGLIGLLDKQKIIIVNNNKLRKKAKTQMNENTYWVMSKYASVMKQDRSICDFTNDRREETSFNFVIKTYLRRSPNHRVVY